MQTIEFHSHEQQDEFIFNLFQGHTSGLFLDISCGHPYIGSNSYALEKYCNWSGYCIDLRDCHSEFQWSTHRKAEFVRLDATSQSLTDFLSNNISQNTVVDYLSLDVDAAGTNLALPALRRILDAGVKFKAMTFEHECYYHGPSVRDQTRDLLIDRGYVPLFKDVKLWDITPAQRTDLNFEDWWINSNYFTPNIMSISDENLFYFECIEKLKNFSKMDYSGKHLCSRAWPNEYSLFWNQQEENQLKEIFNQSNK